MEKDFSSVSPSANSLLIMKGLTDIPYAKEAAALMPKGKEGVLDTNARDVVFWAKVTHFEGRYWSIDQLLQGTGIANILELSSGYSFRGLDMATKQKVHYIDTDLPDVIATKKQFIETLDKNTERKGKLELLSLNAIDESEFNKIVDRFEPGPIAIVNEGLLMYLNMEEKKRLCDVIHKTLRERGGCWITADIYKRMPEMPGMRQSDREKKFFEQHNTEENKFGSFEEAKAFFNEMGFEVMKEAEPEHEKLTALKHMLENATPEMIEKLKSAGKMQATWMLKVV